jgi:hypothetical protein
MSIRNQKNDFCEVTFYGKIVAIKEASNKRVICLGIGDECYFLDVWKEDLDLSKFQVTQSVVVECVVRNNNYTKNNENVYSYNFVVEDIGYCSGRPAIKWSCLGRLTKDLEIHTNSVCGSIAINGAKTTFIPFSHKDFNENIGVLSGKGQRVFLCGTMVKKGKDFSFYANRIIDCT